MPTYITKHPDGTIAERGNWEFPGSELVDYDVVMGADNKLHRAGTEPQAPSEEDILMLRLRHARDARLDAADKYLLSDYPISDSDLAAVKSYRQALRDLPAQPGAPWDGGGDETPWPELPKT